MVRRLLMLCACVALIAVAGAAGAEPVPRLSDLASGSYSRMHMLLEKTIFNVDVAEIDVAVDTATRDRLAAAAADRAYSPSLELELARIALSADHAIVQMKFLRRVSLQQWIDGVRESIAHAKAAGLVEAKLANEVSGGLPQWFEASEARGFYPGDTVRYHIKPKSLRSLIVRKDGTVVVDRTDNGADKSDMVLATYFARGTPYRAPLLRSLH